MKRKMKKLTAILMLGALLCFAGCTDIRTEHDTTDETNTESAGNVAETDSTTAVPAETSDGYTKRY